MREREEEGGKNQDKRNVREGAWERACCIRGSAAKYARQRKQ